ncbi:uncharacterized protein ACN63O_003312 [Diretmus argenteus]
MGRYLGTNLCANSLDGRTLRLYCKIRYLLSILRDFPRLAKTPRSLERHSYSPSSSPHPHSFARKAIFKKLEHSYTGSTSDRFLRDCREVKYLQVVRFYSSSNRDAFKSEAPIGGFQHAQNTLYLGSLGVRLGQSFNRLSRHVNAYFKRKDIPVVPLVANASLFVTTPEYLTRLQRRGQSQRVARQRRALEDKDTAQTLTCEDKRETSQTQPETGTSPQAYSGLQLFHISSLASRFGESYSYVANHINSVFSHGHAKEVQVEETLDKLSDTRGSSRRNLRSYIENSKGAEKSQVEMDANQVTVEEGYLHFARRINRYFGAKVTDEADRNQKDQLSVEDRSTNQRHFSPQSTSKPQGAPSQLKQGEHVNPKTGGLFHTSSHTTHFGENYFQMANHINQYFKGQGALEEEMDRNLFMGMDPESATTQKLKTLSFMDCLRHPATTIPNLLGGYLKLGPWAQTSHSKPATASLERAFNRRVSCP